MTVKEKIERLKRQKTMHSTEELDRLGWARYEEIKEELEAKHHGEYVVIEVDSGDYFVGKTAEEAFQQAEEVHPDKAFCLIRVGYKAAHKLKRHDPVMDVFRGTILLGGRAHVVCQLAGHVDWGLTSEGL